MNEWMSIVANRAEIPAPVITQAIAWLVDDSIPAETKADFLIGLADKGETPAEITGFAADLRSRALALPLPSGFTDTRELLDVCGTGGDRLNTFNISTTVGLLCAASKVAVAKHGNRAVTSAAGSADVLEALGIPIDLSPTAAARAIEEHGFAFLFAPQFHPAFKGIGPARRLCASRGRKTIFNFLGPLLNPARPTVQLLGVPQPHLTGPMARTLQSLGLRRAMVVSGEVMNAEGTVAFLDELSTLGENTVAEFHQDRGYCESKWSATEFELTPAGIGDLGGGDARENAAIVEAILSGQLRGPKLEAVLLNAGAALFLAGKARSIGEGWRLADETIQSGAASKKLQALRSIRS